MPAVQDAAISGMGETGSATGKGREDVPLLEVSHLSTQFATKAGAIHAVDDVSFDIDVGETLCIVGESGSGKSVTGLSIMRLVPGPAGKVVSGTIKFGGRDILEMSEEEVRAIRGNQIAMVFQDPMSSLNPVLTVGKQLSETLRLHLGMSKEEARARSIALLELVGIANAKDRIDLYPHQYSGGMRQRIMIAIALSCNPKLMIADEPTTALDVTVQAQILELIKKQQAERGTGMILITHSMGVVAAMADRVLVMYAGQIVERASAQEIFTAPKHPYSIGLLDSIPRLDAVRKEKLKPIPGAPPDLLNPPDRCAFAPRCSFARPKCHAQRPPLLAVSPGHASACWYWEELPPRPVGAGASLAESLPSDG